MLRMPLNPTKCTARDTVLMLPLRAKWALLTSRSSLLVKATSLRISLVTLLTLSFSERAMLWMREIESDKAGKSLLCRIRRNKNSRVASAPVACSAAGALSESVHSTSSLRNKLALAKRCWASSASARCTMARNRSSTPAGTEAGNTSCSWVTR